MGQKWKREGAEGKKKKSNKIKRSSRDAEAFQHFENASAYLFTMWQVREFCSPVFKVTFSKENKHTLYDHRKDFLTNTRVSALLNVTSLNSLQRWVFNPAPCWQSFCPTHFLCSFPWYRLSILGDSSQDKVFECSHSEKYLSVSQNDRGKKLASM